MRRLLLLFPFAFAARMLAQRTSVGDEQQGSKSPGGFPAIWLRGSKPNGNNVPVIVDANTMTLDPLTNTLSAKVPPGSAPIFVDEEVPQGIVDGVNRIFTLLNVPNPPSSLKLISGGIRLRVGVANDYILQGKTITYNDAPPTGRTHCADYRM